MKFVYKNLFNVVLFLYLIIGGYYSLQTGISIDERHEQINWEYNIALIKNIFFGIQINPVFDEHVDYFYGIGFHLISQPIQFFLREIVINFQNIDLYGAHLVSKHLVIFITFFISGIFFRLLLKKVIENDIFVFLSTLIYLFYPYLLGHSFFNLKDIPFMSFWLICTYLSFNIFEKLIENKLPNYLNILIFSFLSAYLISIRLTGILIFFQYLITLLIFISVTKINFGNFFKKIYKQFSLFIILTVFFTYILYPVFWQGPLLILEAINSLSKWYLDVCTLTLGKCMESKNLDPTYIPIWLMVKLPLLILIGIILLPFSEKKIFINKKNSIFFGTILLTTFLIPLFLIFRKAHLYDEVRHILFLFPFIFMLATISLYQISKKIFFIFSFLTLVLFTVENFKIHPYQYVWFNAPSRVLELNKKFELDYWGLSGRNLAKKITEMKLSDRPCILVGPVWSIKSFLDEKLFNCYGAWGAIDSDYPRPFLAVQHLRNLKKGRSYKCDTYFETEFKLLFTDQKFVTGRILECT